MPAANIPTAVKIDWLLLLAKIGWIDVLFVVVFVLGVFLGLQKGLGKVSPYVISLLVAETAAVEYYRVMAQAVNARVPIPLGLLEIVIFARLVTTSFAVVEFTFRMLTMWVNIEFKPFAKNVGGALFSGAGFVLAMGLLSTFLLFFPVPAIHEALENKCLSGPYLAALTPRVHSWLRPLIPETLRAVL